VHLSEVPVSVSITRVTPTDSGAMQRSSMSGSRRSAQNGESEVPGSGAKKPRASAFYQQRLPAWNPVLTPAMIYVVLLSTGCLFIALGVALYVASAGVVELKYTYDGNGTVANCAGANGTNVKSCTISFKVPSDMAPPVYVYYELSNFYQNHRRYVQSRNYPQSMGTIYTDASSLSTCDPLIKASNGKILHPCGLIANSFFNGECFSSPIYPTSPSAPMLTPHTSKTFHSASSQTPFAPRTQIAFLSLALSAVQTRMAGLKMELPGPLIRPLSSCPSQRLITLRTLPGCPF